MFALALVNLKFFALAPRGNQLRFTGPACIKEFFYLSRRVKVRWLAQRYRVNTENGTSRYRFRSYFSNYILAKNSYSNSLVKMASLI